MEPTTNESEHAAANWQAACEMHCEMFRHYSSMLFKARVSIITVILAVFAALFGFKRIESQIPGEAFPIEPTAMIAYVAAITIALLYSMETAYIRRLAEVAASARQSTRHAGAFGFFSAYQPLWHWPLLVLYLTAIIFLLVIFDSRTPNSKFLALLLLVPPGLLAYTFKEHSAKLNEFRARQHLAESPKAEPIDDPPAR